MKHVCKKILSLMLIVALIVAPFEPIEYAMTESVSALSYSGSSSYMSGKYYTNLTKVNLTGDQGLDIVNVAESQVGYQEGSSSSKLSGTVKGSGNYTEYGSWYGMQDMWCAMFVSWCAHVAGISTSIIPSHSYTPSGLNWFRDRGLAYKRSTVANGGYTPQAGDIIYFKSSRNQNITNHIGIVTGYSNRTVYTIEGNTSSATISTNGGAVAAKSYSIDNTYIVYICKPDYKVPETPIAPSEPLKTVVFNADYYGQKYSDVSGLSEDAKYEHFMNTGLKEGRQASPNFDVKYYLENNPTVQAAIGSGTDYKKAYDYYVEKGYLEVVHTAKSVDIGTDFYAKIHMQADRCLTYDQNPESYLNNVYLEANLNSRAQLFHFTRQSNGSYKIVNTKNSLCLAITGKARNSGSNVELNLGYGGTSQSWFIYEWNGRYMLRPYCSGACVLDVYGASTATGTNIQIYNANCSAAQFFDIAKQEYDAVNGTKYSLDVGDDVLVKIKNIETGKYLSNCIAEQVTWTEDDHSATRLWRLEHTEDGSYIITGQNIYQSLSIEETSGGTTVRMMPELPEYSATRRWRIFRTGAEGYVLQSAASDSYYLQMENTVQNSNDVNAKVAAFDGGVAQKIQIEVVDYLNDIQPSNRGDEFLAKIEFADAQKNLSLADTDIITYTSSDSPAQVWRFVRQQDNSYKIINQKNGMLLDTKEANGTEDVEIVLSVPGQEHTSGWFFYLNSGLWTLRPSNATNCVMAVDGGSTADEANVLLNDFEGAGRSRLFRIEPIADLYTNVVTTDDLGDEFYSKIIHTSSGNRVCLAQGSDYDVTIESENSNAGQTWQFNRQSDGSYTIMNRGNGHYLNVRSDKIVNTHGKESSGFLNSQRWFIYLKEGSYVVRSVAYPDCLLSLENGATEPGTNLCAGATTCSDAQLFSIDDNKCGTVSATNGIGATDEQMEVYRNIMYAVETGGQVYGNAAYDDFTEAYTNTDLEHAITIGAGQWFGPEAKTLLVNIRNANPSLFESLDTEGI